MDTRYIIAAAVWAIVCAGIIHCQPELSTEGSSGQTTTTQDIFTQETTTIVQVQENVHQGTPTPSNTSEINLNTTEIAATTTKITTADTKGFTTDIGQTTSPKSTKPENCMVSRKDHFIECFESLGNNAVKYMATRNLTGFLGDICDVNRSKPYMECIKRHFRECPDFLNRTEVQVLQFGPYHIKDIIYFSSIDQMCSCATGLVCIQELLKVKRVMNLTNHIAASPWLKMPNYELICHNDTSRYIGCVRKNLRQCQSPLTKRYGEDFTNEDAEDIKRLHDFSKEHCHTVNQEDFSEKYKCIEERSTSEAFRDCIRVTENLPNARKICRIRECVKEILEDECDSDDLIPLYIDAVNIYRRDSVRLLNKQCLQSGAAEIGISIVAFVLAICIVIFI